jgi:uncharacterized membrane-anchored protein
MSFDRPRHRAGTAVDTGTPDNQRKVFLGVLGQVLRETYTGITAETVLRGGSPVLFVVSHSPVLKRADISADFTDDGWWYAWARDSRTIGPVEDSVGVARAIASWLRSTT